MKHFASEARRDWRDAQSAVATALASTAIARDQAGGIPLHERRLLRESGLLTLSIPSALGGLGAPWSEVLGVVQHFARVDSAVAHVFGFHHLLLATAQLFGQPAQWQPWLEATVAQRWFWGNALNPLDKGTVATQAPEGHWLFDGRKSFCSGAGDSDQLLASAFDASGKLLIAVVPTGRAGIRVQGDWDNMGQRQTDSGSVAFEQVRIHAQELLLDPGPLSSPFAALRPLLAQMVLAHVYLGLGEGALAEARGFTLQHARAWHASGVDQAGEDPYLLGHYGDFWLALEGAGLLAQRARALFDAAWAEGMALTPEARGNVAIAVAAAKVAASRAALDVAHRLFEVTGPRATTAALRMDRFWRNLRVHTLHDPIDYKRRELGRWALHAQPPPPSFYS
ncbi:acyl-CoA dehydrogenase family protein [Acidovorax sp. NCPPB 4044]|uniref:acyl-CoA dehydrogenase family protein n=1 Tax=Acidovorax sp. NCPPB 4044 TaxID=2940490 RepID=UPI00230493C1|nr:acyl-CoA dehydrogenase family protein [Acidovorax sp. NCPPB 4044]MDA8519360.1 acyl-CoA dehydrogenase family protein [Acidovorax sp. NCPPB 4044]